MGGKGLVHNSRSRRKLYKIKIAEFLLDLILIPGYKKSLSKHFNQFYRSCKTQRQMLHIFEFELLVLELVGNFTRMIFQQKTDLLQNQNSTCSNLISWTLNCIFLVWHVVSLMGALFCMPHYLPGYRPGFFLLEWSETHTAKYVMEKCSLTNELGPLEKTGAFSTQFLWGKVSQLKNAI